MDSQRFRSCQKYAEPVITTAVIIAVGVLAIVIYYCARARAFMLLQAVAIDGTGTARTLLSDRIETERLPGASTKQAFGL